MSSSNSPCAACKCLRRKCTPECVFAPYFPPEKPEKFACVHKVFGASNVSKILNELNPVHREEAVNSLAYEAEARLHNPIYGCVGFISILQQRLKQVHEELKRAKRELSVYIQPSGEYPFFQNNPSSSSFVPYNNMTHNAQLVIREPHAQHMLEAQQIAMVKEQQEMLRAAYEQQQQDTVRFEDGFAQGRFNSGMSGSAMAPSLGLGSFENAYQVQEHFQNLHLQPQPQFLLQKQQQEAQQQQRSGSEEGPNAGPSVDFS